jgi:hypothetical protein
MEVCGIDVMEWDAERGGSIPAYGRRVRFIGGLSDASLNTLNKGGGNEPAGHGILIS